MNIDELWDAIKNNSIRITNHAFDEARNDDLKISEILNSVLNGEIIEDYPTDFPLPSCLIMGNSMSNEPIHSVWGYNMNSKSAILITVYRPASEKWVAWKTRRT